jgi:hypothetical protein
MRGVSKEFQRREREELRIFPAQFEFECYCYGGDEVMMQGNMRRPERFPALHHPTFQPCLRVSEFVGSFASHLIRCDRNVGE